MNKYEFQDQVLTLKEISKITGIPDSTIRARLKNGCSIDDAATSPIHQWGAYKNTRKYKYKGQFLTLKEISILTSIKINIIRQRLILGWPLTEATETTKRTRPKKPLKTKKPKANKSKVRKKPKKYKYKGQSLTLTELSKLIGISRSTIHDRIEKWHWSVHNATTTPVGQKPNKSLTIRIMQFLKIIK